MSKNEVKQRFDKTHKKFNKSKNQKFEFKKKVSKTTKLEENIESLKAQYEKIDTKNIKSFKDFPISSETLKALRESGFEAPTEIQKESIGLALQGHDILGKNIAGNFQILKDDLFQELLKRVQGKL